jgi:hypothetical protein
MVAMDFLWWEEKEKNGRMIWREGKIWREDERYGRKVEFLAGNRTHIGMKLMGAEHRIFISSMFEFPSHCKLGEIF